MEEIAIQPLGELSQTEYKEVIKEKEYFQTKAEWASEKNNQIWIVIYTGAPVYTVPEGYFFYITSAQLTAVATANIAYGSIKIEGGSNQYLIRLQLPLKDQYDNTSVSLPTPIKCFPGDLIIPFSMNCTMFGSVIGYLLKI